MTCPDTGTLRAALDGERPDITPHVGTCTDCEARARDLADGAVLVATALQGEAGPIDVDASLARFRGAAPAEVVPLAPRARRRPRLALQRVAAALVVVVVTGAVLATPGGRATASSVLERFRAERLAAVPVNFAAVDPAALEGLIDVAEVEGLDDLIEPQPVADLAEAEAVAGFAAVPFDDAPGPVTVLAQAPQTVRIDFDDDADLPPALRQATLVLDVPGAVLQAAGGEQDGMPVAGRGEAGQLGVTVEGGPTLAEVREALLSLPGLPPETVAALRAIEDWETTLPLPVPVGQLTWQETMVGGQPALAFGDDSGLASALLWNDGERFVGVGGRLPLSETRRLAEGS